MPCACTCGIAGEAKAKCCVPCSTLAGATEVGDVGEAASPTYCAQGGQLGLQKVPACLRRTSRRKLVSLETAHLKEKAALQSTAMPLAI